VSDDDARTRDLGDETRAILRGHAGGDASATERLWALAYDQLRALAESRLRRFGEAHTLQPTALVHEVFLRLVGQPVSSLEDRAHFLAISARAMRHVLIDHARRKASAKRGGSATRIRLADADVAASSDEFDFTTVHVALERLSALDARKAAIVEMRFFGGLTSEEAAAALGVSRTTVSQEWRFARAWLSRELGRESRA
jgi:RNA polymerase sigma factor (TIGR02999 family)